MRRTRLLLINACQGFVMILSIDKDCVDSQDSNRVRRLDIPSPVGDDVRFETGNKVCYEFLQWRCQAYKCFGSDQLISIVHTSPYLGRFVRSLSRSVLRSCQPV